MNVLFGQHARFNILRMNDVELEPDSGSLLNLGVERDYFVRSEVLQKLGADRQSEANAVRVRICLLILDRPVKLEQVGLQFILNSF